MTNVYTYKNLELNGRTGNQLWQMAAMMNAARRNGGRAIFKKDWEYRPYFSVPDYFFGDAPEESIDGGTEYFQELHYMEGMEDQIREFFQPSKESLDYMANNEMYATLDDAERKCSIHVRRGDYVGLPHHFPLPTEKYYNDAINLVKQEDPDITFVVFSDEIEWCKTNLNIPDATYITGIPRPVEVTERKRAGSPKDQYDLFAMAKCDRHIIANSTFSWWGAWLSNDNRVIHPSKWFGDHPAVRDIPWRAMIPGSWIEVGT